MTRAKLITIIDPKSPTSEAYRTLRTNIQFSSIDKEIKTIAITSSTPSEGKSTIASNLAYIMGQGDKKVLLIDCDMRKPSLHKVFKIGNYNGLTNVLMGDKPLEDIVYKNNSLTNLSILTSGPIPPNPAELLGSKRMRKFLKEVNHEYDIIILDTPPVGLVTDSAVLSTMVDGVILVAAVGHADIGIVKGAKQLLDKVDANIIGVILNKVPVKGRYYYNQNYLQYYDYFNEEAEESEGKRKKRKRRAKA